MKLWKRILQTIAALLCLTLAVGAGALLPDALFYYLGQNEQEEIALYPLDAVSLTLTEDMGIYDKMALVSYVFDNGGMAEPEKTALVSSEAEVEFAARFYLEYLIEQNHRLSGSSYLYDFMTEMITPCAYIDYTEMRSAVFWYVNVNISHTYYACLIIDDETLEILAVELYRILAPSENVYVERSDMMAFADAIARKFQKQDPSAIWMDQLENAQIIYNDAGVPHYAYMEKVLLARSGDRYYRFYCSIDPVGVFFNRGFASYSDSEEWEGDPSEYAVSE